MIKQIGRNAFKAYQAYCEAKCKTPHPIQTMSVVAKKPVRAMLSCQVKDMTPSQVRRWMTTHSISMSR